MKKIIMFLMAAFMLSAVPATAQELSKEAKKSIKAKIKEFKKDGWKIFGSAYSIEYALNKHYAKLESPDAEQQIGVSVASTKNKNLGRQKALTNACIEFVSRNETAIKGKVLEELGDNGNGEEFDKFFGTFKKEVQGTIKDELKESFSVIRDNGDGTFEMQIYFVYDKTAASKARMRAIDRAAREDIASKLYAEGIKKYFEEGGE